MTIYVMIRDPPYARLAANTIQLILKRSLFRLKLTNAHENQLQCAALNHEGHENLLQRAAPNHEGHESSLQCAAINH